MIKSRRPAGRLDTEVREKVREIARKPQRFGNLRSTTLLRRQGLRVKHRLIHGIRTMLNRTSPVHESTVQ